MDLTRRSPAHAGLERLRSRLTAARVSLIRFHRGDSTFAAVASTGFAYSFPLLAPGVRLPIAVSAVALLASRGRVGRFSEARTERPLESTAALLGMRSGMAMPLDLATVPLGAVIALWDDPAPPAAAVAHAMVDAHRSELLHTLVSPRAARPQVIVCHEDALTAGGLGQLVERQLGADAAVAHTPNQAVAAVSESRPDLIILSDQFSEAHPPGAVTQLLRDSGAGAPLLLLARRDTAGALESAFEAGATGYLPLDDAATRLTTTAADVIDGRSALPKRRIGAPPPRLTERERDVLRCLERGLSDKQIAHELGVATSTVKTHGRGLYRKLSATSRTKALHQARVAGLL